MPSTHSSARPASANHHAPSSSTPRYLMGCGAAFLSVCLIGLISLSLGWSAFVRFGVTSDLDKYSVSLKHSDLQVDLQKTYIKRVDDLRMKVDEQNTSISFFKWIDVDKRMKRLTQSNHFDEVEIEQLEREVQRMERLVQ